MKASKFEVFHIVYEAIEHRITIDKIGKLFMLCDDTPVPVTMIPYIIHLIYKQYYYLMSSFNI